MQFEVELGEVEASWRYPGSVTFKNWLENRPWSAAGAFCVIRSEKAARDIAFKSIQKAAHAVHCNNGEFCVKLVECGGELGPPQAALMRNFQLSRPPLEAIDDIRLCLREVKQLLVFVEAEPVGADDWERFIALAEHLGKSNKAVPLAIVVLDERSAVAQEPTYIFHAGHADLQIFGGAAAVGDGEVWNRFVYLRAWWDAGGSIERATELWKRCNAVSVGDDEGLEAVLQTYALEIVHQHQAWSQLKAMHGIVGSSQPLLQGSLGAEAELLEANFLWRAPGLQSLRVVPIAARALLAERLLPEAKRWALRSALVCSPLVAECLGLCQFFETQIRTRLHGRDDLNKLPNAVDDRFRDFKAGDSEYVRYPNCHPAPPNQTQDLLAFASFGETLTSCPKTAVSDADRSIQHLRNCLAHGHYVTWWHCKLALKHLRRLDSKGG